MASMYYRNAAAAIVCFDITDEESFSKMKDWVQELKSNVPEGKLVIAIACNKTDLEGQRVVSRARAEAYARTIGAIYCETSAKENWGVTEIFEQVSGKVIELRGDELRSAAAAQQRGAYGGNRNPRLVPPSASGRFNDEQKQSSCCG
eukprot:CAMPEP_0117756480 /NCGR_PEP_ID=MMETSP0947-20121206/14106_1 /TAXON_ID=44440 /ORGANISM="Chattonella subsalsa, Strain CCMP2191" /LENGTH=146 /DNA_ID=CAMNT_0005576081 /DNA_START=273 /DNA_END=713 /DNA_ORIENTATION=+